VVDFLVDMAARVSGGNDFELPMSRQDIADYLGLTIETVSRTMTHLASAAAIELPSSRRVILRKRLDNAVVSHVLRVRPMELCAL
jgi:CRP/FNR family nitrogen fixation transcriptional regulator